MAPDYEINNVFVQEKDPKSLLKLYKTLLQIRKENLALQIGEQTLYPPVHPDVLIYTRTFLDKTIWVALNLGTEEIALQHFARPQIMLTTHEKVSENFKLRAYEGIMWQY